MESGKARELNMREDRVNLYGVPFRTWVLMRNSSSLDMERSISQSDQLRSNQFSSQERNQDSLNEILHEVHDDFHTYFVLIVTVLCGMISAIVFLLILATIAKCCCSGGQANCKTQPSKYKDSASLPVGCQGTPQCQCTHYYRDARIVQQTTQSL